MPGEQRPDPDALLAQVQADEAKARRGKLKIFFGASAGVGKTFAMLAAARAAVAQGRPVLVGVVETHGRSETEAMARDLPRLPPREVPYRGRVLKEFDLDAALAWEREHPEGVLLLDELAHSNVPSDAGQGLGQASRHPKRWQDVEELLAAGVDVWTTVNVQHLESLNDIVSGITGVRVWETVPDRLFDEADEVVVVDLPPDELLLRLRQGKVYLPQQAERAAANFFRKGNLLALRELALRRTADRVDEEMQAYRKHSAVQAVWPNRESLLACVGPGEHGEKVVRSCARLAAQLDVPWHAVHVQTPSARSLRDAERQQMLHVLKLAAELGATVATLSAPEAAPALARYAREHNLSRLVLGRRDRHWRWPPGRRTLADRLVALADDMDVLQVALPAASRGAAAPEPAPARPGRWRGYVAAPIACALTTGAALPLAGVLELSNIVMLFLLAVVGVALAFGRGPAVLAAFLGVAAFDFFFVPPQLSFAVSDVQYLLTFAVMLAVALVIGQLTAGLKGQAAAAEERERRVRSLYEMARDLGSALMVEQVAEIGARFLVAEFGARHALYVTDPDDRLLELPGATAKADPGVAQWAYDHAQAAGRGTDTLPASPCLMLPLKAPMRLRGVLAVEPVGPADPAGAVAAAAASAVPWSPEDRQLLDTCASLLANSLERIHYIEVAQASTLQMESERLRNSLLSAISHDLRTPLASLVGLADALRLTQPPLSAQQDEIAGAMKDSALRMNALVNNLLDMARLEAGAVQINRQWQPLEEVVGAALAACAPALAGRPVQVQLPEDLPLLHLDAVLIDRVLANLLENAAKFTPPGTPITVRASARSDSVDLIVEDRGPGLPPGKEELLFEKFERGRKESATPGVGLGLAICRAIAQAHGGSIRAENVAQGLGVGAGESGARFVLTLPRGMPPSDTGSDELAAAAALEGT